MSRWSMLPLVCLFVSIALPSSAFAQHGFSGGRGGARSSPGHGGGHYGAGSHRHGGGSHYRAGVHVGVVGYPGYGGAGRYDRSSVSGRHFYSGTPRYIGRVHVYYPAPAHAARPYWGRGFWGWHGSSWVWIAGPWWSTPAYPGWVWIPRQWVWNGSQWVWQEGYWTPIG